MNQLMPLLKSAQTNNPFLIKKQWRWEAPEVRVEICELQEGGYEGRVQWINDPDEGVRVTGQTFEDTVGGAEDLLVVLGFSFPKGEA